jgi:hypothetical protein
MENAFICPKCKRGFDPEFAFCPHCGQPRPKVSSLPKESLALLEKARREEDPVRKHALLMELRSQHPDTLDIERELLMLGRLHERSRRDVSFRNIKCYLLQIYLDTQGLSGDDIADMRRELFHHPQLEVCQRLAPDGDAFTREYLEDLSGDFIQLFLEGSNLYMRSLFGFVNHRNAPALLAPHAARMLENISGDDQLTQSERQTLLTAFYRAFALRMNGETAKLDKCLAEKGLTI